MLKRMQWPITARMLLFFVMFTALLLDGVSTAHAATFDDSIYQKFLDRNVVTDRQIGEFKLNVVDYEGIYRRQKDPDSLYRKVLSQFAVFDPDSLSNREDKIAFWINTYNIGAIKMIMDHYPVDSIRSREINWLKNPWEIKVLTVGGRAYSLSEMEHEILLGKLHEPLVHFAIVCASLSCPDISPDAYSGSEVMEQMAARARIFLRNPRKGLRIDKEKGEVHFSQIFKFDKNTFPEGARSAIPLIGRFLEEADREYLVSGEYKIQYFEYDWSANTLSKTR